MPKRIQRKRTKGWRMPAGAVYVGRPTKWGNPWAVHPGCDGLDHWCQETPRIAVLFYRQAVLWPVSGHPPVPTPDDIRRELIGKDLVCWCPVGLYCHADVLLEVANGTEP